MTPQIEILLDKIKALETELIEELQKQEKEFSYEIQKSRVFFEKTSLSGIRNTPNGYSTT